MAALSGGRSGPSQLGLSPEIWRTEGFQRWYQAQCGAGNRVEEAEVLWSIDIGDDASSPSFWAMKVAVYVAAEHRVKVNEVVVSRPDASSVALYRPGRTLDDTIVVLVREFRSAARTADGFVRELPGGSGPSGDAITQGVNELREETGLVVDPTQLHSHGSRQVASTLLTHHVHLFSAEISDTQLSALSELANTVHGDGLTERTWIEIRTFGDIRRGRLVDWSTLGMLAQVLLDGY